MRFSVVIPVKQDPAGLELTLASLPQDSQLQIIVIDGGSDSRVIEVVEQNLQRIHYWESGLDSGIADAMNHGVAKADGDWVSILNAGDAWMPHTLAEVRTSIRLHQSAAIHHGIIEYINEQGETHQVSPDIKRLPERMYVFHPTLFVANSCYQSVGAYDTTYRYAMDSNWCHRAVAQGKQFVAIPRPLAQMALGGRSDLHYVRALREYRRSVVETRLASPPFAAYCYVKVLLGKWLLSHSWVRRMAKSYFGDGLARSSR